MGKISDEELLFLSNLMHVKKEESKGNIFGDIWTEDNTGDNVQNELCIGEIVAGMNQKLSTLTEAEKKKFCSTVFDGEIEGSEWVKMLQSIQNNPNLCALKLYAVDRDDKGALTICLTDNEGNAYVIFRGTGPGEWPDNFAGGYKADTEQQRRALAFVESLSGFESITVAGHSKGGNKAKYVALLSDKVSRCVSFDGQGFSKEFLEKYAMEIKKNKWKITNYALSMDFVNPLLFDINPECKKYEKGFGIGIHLEQFHSPSSFWKYVGEEYGFEETKQSGLMQGLHQFINYVVNVAGDKEKKIMFDYLGGLAERFMGKKPPNYEEPYTQEEKIDYILSNKNLASLELLFMYILKYGESESGIWISPLLMVVSKLDVEGFASLLKLSGKIGKEEYRKIKRAMIFAQKHYKSLPLVPAHVKDYKMSSKKRDFSQDMKEKLLGICDKTVREPFYDIDRWNVLYGGEKWMSRINIERYKQNIRQYSKDTKTANEQTKKQIEKVFAEVDKIDKEYAEKINNITADIKKIRVKLEKI